MVLYPGVQIKAHEELDRIIGPDRLLLVSDMSTLPYINAICQEVLRWHPVIPLGAPHRAIKDDIYRGMFIPKDSTIIYNTW